MAKQGVQKRAGHTNFKLLVPKSATVGRVYVCVYGGGFERKKHVGGRDKHEQKCDQTQGTHPPLVLA